MPQSASYAVSPRRQSARHTPAARHSWSRRRADEDDEHSPVAEIAFHWEPVRSRKKVASIARRSSTRGLWQPSGCAVRGGTSGAISAHSASGVCQLRRTRPADRAFGPNRLGAVWASSRIARAFGVVSATARVARRRTHANPEDWPSPRCARYIRRPTCVPCSTESGSVVW